MKIQRIMLEAVILFGIGVLILNGVIIYQDRIISQQRVVIKEMLQHCGGK